jgi:hypothetical protein
MGCTFWEGDEEPRGRLQIKHMPLLNAPFAGFMVLLMLFSFSPSCGIPLAIVARQKEEGRPGASDLAHVEELGYLHRIS